MEYSKSAFSGMIDMITDPKKAFVAADQHPKRLWMPFLLTLISSVVVLVVYFYSVDMAWFFEQTQITLAAAGKDEIPDEAQMMFTPLIMTGMASVGVVFWIGFTALLSAVYLLVIAKVTSDDNRGFGHWFGLVSWSMVPFILASIIVLVYYLVMGNPQMSLEEANFFSFNELVFHYAAGTSEAKLWGSISIFNLWSVGLLALGLKTWTNRSMISSLVVAVIPTVVIIGSINLL